MPRSPYDAPVTRPGPEFPDVAALEGLARSSSASGPTPGEMSRYVPGPLYRLSCWIHRPCALPGDLIGYPHSDRACHEGPRSARPKVRAGRNRHHGALKLSSGEDRATSLPTTLARADKEKFMDDLENGMSHGQRPEKRLSPSVREVA